MNITDLLACTVNNGASDLHLSAGLPAMIRIDGDLHRIKISPLDQQQILVMLHSIMTEQQIAVYEEKRESDFSIDIAELGRFRVNVFNQARGPAAVFRTIPNVVKSLTELGLGQFADLCKKSHGLVLVTGATGSGKSTTLAAMINEINQTQRQHILTIEDPIEFVHQSQQSLINQREVHRDTLSYAAALRSALREDPDVILLGEMRDLETIRLALTAAETGHLVFATLHSSSAVKAIDRIVDVFSAEEKALIRSMLSESLEAVISQTLIKKARGAGRVLAHEIMICNSAIRNLIRENKAAQMYAIMETASAIGMITLDQHLQHLVEEQFISADQAAEYAKYSRTLA